MTVADANRVVLTGENPFIRLSATDGSANTTNASFWRIIFCPAGPGHVLYLKSELTENRWRIYSDNIAMARWLQSTVQGMLNAELADTTIPVTDAEFTKSGDPRYFWTERVVARDEDIALTWYDIGDPLLIHTQPNAEPGRPYGVCTVLIPALGARLSRNGVQAAGGHGRGSARAGRSAPARWRSPRVGRRCDRAKSPPRPPRDRSLTKTVRLHQVGGGVWESGTVLGYPTDSGLTRSGDVRRLPPPDASPVWRSARPAISSDARVSAVLAVAAIC